MRDAENESHEGKRKAESLWPIMQISHARSRYVYELYYKREAISKPLYDWLLKEGFADANLIAKWKKPGYEKLCCLRCIQTKDMNYQGSTCICRVPKAQVRSGTVVNCVHCGSSIFYTLCSSMCSGCLCFLQAVVVAVPIHDVLPGSYPVRTAVIAISLPFPSARQILLSRMREFATISMPSSWCLLVCRA
ncbi:G10 protein-domain-containing protein [Lentinula raphanica]|nr:G10 protein-domain-containing protein [Lentinula raphanica]